VGAIEVTKQRQKPKISMKRKPSIKPPSGEPPAELSSQMKIEKLRKKQSRKQNRLGLFTVGITKYLRPANI
jgi:hypothetical protein